MKKISKARLIYNLVFAVIDLIITIGLTVFINAEEISLFMDNSMSLSAITGAIIIAIISLAFMVAHLICALTPKIAKAFSIALPIVYAIAVSVIIISFIALIGNSVIKDDYYQTCSSPTFNNENLQSSDKMYYDCGKASTFLGSQRDIEQNVYDYSNDDKKYEERYTCLYRKANSKWMYNKLEKQTVSEIEEEADGLKLSVTKKDGYTLYVAKGIIRHGDKIYYQVGYDLIIDDSKNIYYYSNYSSLGTNNDCGYNLYSVDEFLSDTLKNYQNCQKIYNSK